MIQNGNLFKEKSLKNNQKLKSKLKPKRRFVKKKKLLTSCLKRRIVWKYVDNNQILFKTIEPQESLKKIICILDETLQSFDKPSLLNYDSSGFYKVMKGQRKQYLGWSIFFIYL